MIRRHPVSFAAGVATGLAIVAVVAWAASTVANALDDVLA